MTLHVEGQDAARWRGAFGTCPENATQDHNGSRRPLGSTELEGPPGFNKTEAPLYGHTWAVYQLACLFLGREHRLSTPGFVDEYCQRSLDRDCHRGTGDPRRTQLQVEHSLSCVRWHAEVHLPAVRGAGVAHCCKDFSRLAIHGNCDW